MRFFESVAFVLLIISIPIQLGKHFWPEFSFVQGLRVDYLSPTIFLSDIFFVLLFTLSFWRLKKELITLIRHPLFIATIAIVLLGIVGATSSLAGFVGVLKLLEFIYVAFYISTSLSHANYALFRYFIVLGGLIQVVILTLQFYGQKSLGGVFYFLGERTFDASTPGIAIFRWGDGLIMRPYGTFPHPNVLAFFLFLGFVLILFSVNLKKKGDAWVKSIFLMLLGFGIFITFSRVIFLFMLGVLIVWIVRYSKGIKKSTRVRVALVIIFAVFALVAVYFRRFESGLIRDALLRVELIAIGFQIFMKNILLGVGINNFFYHEVSYQKQLTPTLLQPIHNIFLHWIIQTGVAGAIVMTLFIRYLLKKVVTPVAMVLVLGAFIVGFFDHYLITLQQGQLMLALIVGLSFSELSSGGQKPFKE